MFKKEGSLPKSGCVARGESCQGSLRTRSRVDLRAGFDLMGKVGTASGGASEHDNVRGRSARSQRACVPPLFPLRSFSPPKCLRVMHGISCFDTECAVCRGEVPQRKHTTSRWFLLERSGLRAPHQRETVTTEGDGETHPRCFRLRCLKRRGFVNAQLVVTYGQSHEESCGECPHEYWCQQLDGKGGAWQHHRWHDAAFFVWSPFSSPGLSVTRGRHWRWAPSRSSSGTCTGTSSRRRLRAWCERTGGPRRSGRTMSIDSYPVMPPTLDMLQDVAHSEKAVAFFSTSIDKILFMREAAEMEANRTYFISATAFFGFCLQDDGALGYNAAGCSNKVFLLVSMRNVNGTISNAVGRQYLGNGQNTLASGGVAAQVHLWDMEHHMLLHLVNMDVQPLLPNDILLGRDEFPASSPWSNFTFVLYFEEESGANLMGRTPISEHGRQVGVMSYGISMSFTLTPLLQKAVDSGGVVTKNAFLAVYAADGTVIGISEDAAGGGGARTIEHASVETIPEDSYTKKAISFLRRQHGDICPVEIHLDLDDEEDRLVDMMPFYTEDWGLPSLGTRWCQVLTVPRDNL